MLEMVGALFITGAVLLATWYLFDVLWFQHRFSSLKWLDWKEWLSILAYAACLVVAWWFWWEAVASHIHVSFS